MITYEIRLMFEWGGSCLWGMNDAAKSRFGYDEIERTLPLSRKTKDKLAELSLWHDGALDWGDPTGPSPWTKDDFNQFEAEALSMLKVVQDELGDAYSVRYEPLGGTEIS